MNASLEFLHGAILDRHTLYLYAIEHAADGTENPIVFTSDQQEWIPSPAIHPAAGIVCYSYEGEANLVVVGTSGAISTANRESTQRDAYITQERMPNAYRPLCGAKVIGEHVYVVGASRQVYRRAFGDHRWNKVDRKCQLPLEIESASGFHAIDGSAEHCCLAVGKHGSIWLGDVSDSGDIWTRVEHHLTTGDLHAVHHLGDNHFLVAGAHGIILRVNMLEVEGITHQVTTETFTTVVTAFGKTYLSTDQGNLFCLDQGALSAVETPFSEATGGSLAYADGLLMFATRQQVALFDGRAWEIITPTAYDSD